MDDKELTKKMKIANAKHAIKALGDEGHMDLADGLYAIQFTQRFISDLSGAAFGDYQTPTPDQIRTVFAALFVELGELLQTLNWKPWKENRELNFSRITDEFADILAFLGLLLVYFGKFGISPEMLARAYLRKTKVNFERFIGQVDGYRSDNNTIVDPQVEVDSTAGVTESGIHTA